ncbi:MAG: SulP family inorganic anion transporter [Candidatus Methylumidiphilus sp.]
MKNLSIHPKTGLAGLYQNWRSDLPAGFLVFLIALPLCLGVAVASGFPAMAGIITAIIGGLLVSRINGAHIAITGPAAGLIVVVFNAVQSLGAGDAWAGYRYALAAIVVSGLLQLGLGFFQAGRLSAYFPSTVIHGLLAAIGIIIMAKQIPVMAGIKPYDGAVLAGIAEIPRGLAYFVPEIGFIGLAGLAVLLAWPQVTQPCIKKIPAPIIVIGVGMLLGEVFHIAHLQPGQDFMPPKDVVFGPTFLVDIPDTLWASIVYPDFGKAGTLAFWESVLAITVIGSLETLLVAAAVDKLDPYKRYSDLNRDLRAVGIGNALAGMVGGLPMIVEIVRSAANIDSGAKTGWSNFFHGLFLLLFVVVFPHVIDRIPLASLAALLVYTGYRLASPKTFAERLIIGKAQLAIFLVTIVGALALNLLAGVLLGIATKVLLHWGRGVSLSNMLRIAYRLERQGADTWVYRISGSAIFSNFISLKTAVAQLPDGQHVVFDVSDAYLIDHTVMEFVEQFRQDYTAAGGRCEILGLAELDAYSGHELAVRRRRS